MYVARTFRMSAAAVAAVLTVGTLGATAAQARPAKPGAVTNLTASATTSGLTGGTYNVTARWDAVSNATGYRASITKAGVVLASTTVTSPAWHPTLATSAGAATLSVKTVVGHRQSRARSVGFELTPDTTAPRGSYSSSWDNESGDASITEDSLTDDSPVGQVTRTVSWGDTSSAVDWPIGTTLPTHNYDVPPLAEITFQATVTLKDVWGNQRDVPVAPIVFNDVVAPVGLFHRSSGTIWAKFTKVTLTQDTLTDNRTDPGDIGRSVDWGDDSPVKMWTNGTTISHVYAGDGTFQPVVNAEDQAHNPTTFLMSPVTVKKDATGPRVRLTLPRAKHSVRAWKSLRGKAADAETGLKSVRLKAVEKRGGSWFGYRPTTHTWVKAATKARAFTRAVAFTLKTDPISHRWTAKLAKLRKGTLVYKVQATDRVNNRSTVTHKASLTRA